MKASPRQRLSPHFTVAEFRCRCRRPDCDAAPIDRVFLRKLEEIRVEWGKPLIVTSGARCGYWNSRVGGAETSQHLFGNAVDLHFEHANEAVAFVALAEKMGWGGIGKGKHLVHLDARHGRARWTYDD